MATCAHQAPESDDHIGSQIYIKSINQERGGTLSTRGDVSVCEFQTILRSRELSQSVLICGRYEEARWPLRDRGV